MSEIIAAELLTTQQVAELMKAGQRSVWRWSRSGRMPPPVRIANSVEIGVQNGPGAGGNRR